MKERTKRENEDLFEEVRLRRIQFKRELHMKARNIPIKRNCKNDNNHKKSTTCLLEDVCEVYS